MRRYPYMVLYCCLFALVVLLYSISPASAAGPTDPISNPSVASDGAIYRALDAAEWFWASKGAKPCHGGPIFEYDEVGLDGAAARGAVGVCAVWFERGYMRMIRRMMRHRPVTALASLCYVAVHERGHNLGYVHGQVMCARTSASPPSEQQVPGSTAAPPRRSGAGTDRTRSAPCAQEARPNAHHRDFSAPGRHARAW
jgi:hypothetical protein